jgi:hypothetical protein
MSKGISRIVITLPPRALDTYEDTYSRDKTPFMFLKYTEGLHLTLRHCIFSVSHKCQLQLQQLMQILLAKSRERIDTAAEVC